MKIKKIRAVSLNIPKIPPKSESRRPNWNNTSPRALPINKYPEFSTSHGKMPGANTSVSTWVQVIAEDGTWGLGETSFGEITAAIIDYHFAPLLEGRDCFALEFLNDLMWRSTQRFGAGGIATVAQSGIDLALWDLKGKLLEHLSGISGASLPPEFHMHFPSVRVNRSHATCHEAKPGT